LRAPVETLPAVGSEPLQLPDAVHEVALVELQLSAEVPPLVTPVGVTAKLTDGAGGGGGGGGAVTVIVAVAVPDPPGPVQVSV
jgi:hypothetical protein